MADDIEQSTLLGEDDDRKTNSSVAFSIVNLDDVTEPCISQKQILLIMLFFFVALGTTWFVLHEGCTFIDGLYLVIIIGTTVGYGLDEFMEDTTNQVFLIFYIIFGVALITATLNVLFVGMLDGMQKKSVKFFDAGDEDCFTETSVTEEGGENFLHRCVGDGAYNWLLNFVQSRTFELGMWLIWLFGGSFLMGSYEDWQPLICVYFAIVSGSTVGFGDFAPESQKGKMVCIIWLPISIALTANVFASIFSSILNSFYDESMAELADFRNMCEDLLNVENFVENFEKMDIDGDGELTEAEFITQALINDYGVPPKKLQVLKQYFNELDVDGGGSITIEDFKARINQVHENIKSGYDQGQPKQTAV